MASPLFDPKGNLPPALQERIDSWDECPPRHQHQQYGPLNAYLQFVKFPGSRYLVKPQKLLRRTERPRPDKPSQLPGPDGDHPSDKDYVPPGGKSMQTASAAGPARSTRKAGHLPGSDDEMEETDYEEEASFESVDSNWAQVYAEKPFYPDFTVERFYGDMDRRPDVIRVIIEVASLESCEASVEARKAEQSKENAMTRFRDSVQDQLEGYLNVSMMRHSMESEKILGVAIIGKEAIWGIASRRSDAVSVKWKPVWSTLFDDKLVDTLNKVLGWD